MGTCVETCIGVLGEEYRAMGVEGYTGTHQCGYRDVGIVYSHEQQHIAALRQGSLLSRTK